jgi:hypothetical protein
MMDDLALNKRVSFLKQLVEFHRTRLLEAQAFADTVVVRHHRQKLEKLELVIRNMEHDELIKQHEA